MSNVIRFNRAPDDRGTMGAWWVSREQERARAHAEHCKRMFNADPGYEFVDELPRDDMPRFANLRDGGNMPDPVERPGWAIWACIGLGAFAWPLLAWLVASIIQWGGL